MARPQGARRLGCCTQTPHMAETLRWARSLPGCSVPGHGIYRMCLGEKWEIKELQSLESSKTSTVSTGLPVERGYIFSRRYGLQRGFDRSTNTEWPDLSHVLGGACFYLPSPIPVSMV